MSKATDSTPVTETSAPQGELVLQTLAMPQNTNSNGDIFGGWIMSQMDIAGAIAAYKVAQGRTATVSVDKMSFISPVHVGDIVAIYTQIKGIGRSSIKINIEVWAQDPSYQLRRQVTHALFTYVAITDYGKSRPVPKPMVID